MALQWSTHRKFLYGGSVALIVFFLIIFPVFKKLYVPASCSDGIQNQRETGIDCGGQCERLCSEAYIPLKVMWARGNQIAPGFYNLGAYIENKNTQGSAIVSYTITVYDDQGVFLGTRTGIRQVIPRRNFLIFEPGFEIKERSLGRVSVSLDKVVWRRALDTGTKLEIVNSTFSIDPVQGSRVDSIISNPTTERFKGILASVIVYDTEGNTVAFSETRIDSLEPRSSERIAFTWAYIPKTKVATVEVIPIAPPNFLE